MTDSKRSIARLTLLKIIGAILGVGYSILQVQYLGVSREMEVYFASTSALYLITTLAQSGQLSELFLPIYHKFLQVSGKPNADQCFSVILNIVVIYSIVITLIAIIIAPFLVKLLVPGYSHQEQLLAISIFRIMALMFTFIVGAGFIKTYLHANQIYGRTEIAGLFSVTISIILLVMLYKLIGVWSIVISFVFGRVIELVIYLITLKVAMYKHQLIIKKDGFDNVSFFKSMYATASYSGATQLFSIVLTASISFLPEGMFAIFKYTQQLAQKVREIAFQPLMTVFYTSFSKLPKVAILPTQEVIRKNLSFVFVLNTVILIFAFSFGNSILTLLWGSDKFPPNDIETAHIFLIFNFLAMALSQVGVIFRKVAMSYGFGKSIYYFWTFAQVITAFLTYFLIQYFEVKGLLLIIPINVFMLSSIPFGLLYFREKNLTKVFNFITLFKLLITMLLIVPLGVYFNQVNWDWVIISTRFDLTVILGVKIILLGSVILFAFYLFSIKEISYIKFLICDMRSKKQKI